MLCYEDALCPAVTIVKPLSCDLTRGRAPAAAAMPDRQMLCLPNQRLVRRGIKGVVGPRAAERQHPRNDCGVSFSLSLSTSYTSAPVTPPSKTWEAKGRDTIGDMTDGMDGDLERGVLCADTEEGFTTLKHAEESVNDFLARAKPSAGSECGPWLKIDDPRHPTSSPPRLEEFKVSAKRLLSHYRTRRLEEAAGDTDSESDGGQHPLLPEVKSSRRISTAILAIATQTSVTSGKWILHVEGGKVDGAWGKAARATFEGRLGHTTTVATAPREGETSHVLFVHTRDYGDAEDVKRVLTELRRLHLVPEPPASQPIYYKCEAFSQLDLRHGNLYGITGVSMYNSNKMLSGR